MRILIALVPLFLLFQPPRPRAWGMSYFIHPDRPTACKDYFPDGLSYFFEQVGGYEEQAEVSQVSKVLQIDLSVFQDVDYLAEDQQEVAKHWHNLDTFTAIVDTFIIKVKRTPSYYEKIKHNPENDKIADRSSQIYKHRDTAENRRQLEKMEALIWQSHRPGISE